MKKIVFSLMTLFALALMAGSASAQTNATPYQGGTYSYTLNGIVVQNESTATVTYLTGSGATLPSPITVETTDNSITFSVTYSNTATDGTLQVTIEDGDSNCSNFIQLAIDVQDLPTLDLSILASEANPICQPVNPTPSNNTAASSGVTGNTFTFTVTPDVTNVSADFGYVYTISLPATSTLNGYSIAYSGDGSYDSGTGVVTRGADETDDVFTITYNTTTGIADEKITALISNATLTVTNTSGGGTYAGTFTTDTDDVIVKTLPSIGTFTVE